MAKDLEEVLTKIEDKMGGDSRKLKDLGEHLEYIESLVGTGGGDGSGGESKIDDILVNGTSIVEDKIADLKLKTVEGISVEGTGNISIPTYTPFPSSWRHDTIAHLLADANADTSAVVGKSYLGEVDNVTKAEGLFNGNAEIVLNIMNGGNNHKIIWCIVSSNNVAPYHWEATFSSGNISAKGWTGYQPELVSGTNIKTINNESILGSGNITISGGALNYANAEDIELDYFNMLNIDNLDLTIEDTMLVADEYVIDDENNLLDLDTQVNNM